MSKGPKRTRPSARLFFKFAILQAMTFTQTFQSAATKTFLGAGARLGAAKRAWAMTPVAPDTYVLRLDAKLLSGSGTGGRVGLVAKDDGTGRQHWKFSLISGRQFRISLERGLRDPAAKYVTVDPKTGRLSLQPLRKGAAWSTQSWRCVEVPAPKPPPPVTTASGERIVHTNFVIEGNGASTSTAAGTFSNPIHGGLGQAADPGVYHENGTYYLAATDVPGVWASKDLVTWRPAGAVDAQATFWAPEIFKIPQVPGGYAAAFCNGPNEMRVLSAPTPAGPYAPYLNLGRPGGGFPMDPHVFRDEDGQHYLFTSAYGPAGAIQVRRISPDLRTVDPQGATCVSVLQQPSWMVELVAEGPQVLKHVDEAGAARYYLTFSANAACKAPPLYAMGVATAPTPMGPWTLADYNPLLKWDAQYGYGHHCFVPGPNGGLAVVFHRDPGSFARELMVTGAHFTPEGKLEFDTKLYGTKALP